MARREEAVRLYDERFARMWEFYLAASEMSFRKQNLMNFQIQLTKRQGVVPMTRDYIAREEARLRGVEQRQAAAAAIGGRMNRGDSSSAGCKRRRNAQNPMPDGQAARAKRQARWRSQGTARNSGRETSSMASISADSQSGLLGSRSPRPELLLTPSLFPVA